MKNIYIFPNTQKNGIENAVDKICEKLKKYTKNIFITNEYKKSIEGVKPMDISDFCGDLIITIGGDGTILTAVNLNKNTPILGVNLGHVGFLTELEITEINYIDDFFDDNYKVEERMMISADVMREKEVFLSEIVLNDVLIKTENSFRIMNVEILLDDTSVLDFGGDGVIVATPTGSTAYSLAAGGPVIEPDADCICVTPICANKFIANSFVFSANKTLKIKIKNRNNNLAYLAPDGNNPIRLEQSDEIIIKRADKSTKFIRIKDEKFYNTIKQKIGSGF